MSERELPVTYWHTIVRFAGEFACVELRMQGDDVLSRTILEQSHEFQDVWTTYQEAAAVRFARKDVH